MPPVGFEPTISGGERPQTYALDRAAAGSGHLISALSTCYDENDQFEARRCPLQFYPARNCRLLYIITFVLIIV